MVTMIRQKYSIIALIVATISLSSASVLKAEQANTDIFDCFKSLNLPQAQNEQLLQIKASNLSKSEKQAKVKEFAKANLTSSQKMQVRSCAQAVNNK